MTNSDAEHTHVAIIGTGFAGLGMAIKLKQAGIEDFVVLERAHEVGGTWRDNTYPGCQCDVPSHLYSFSFAANPRWSRTFSRQAEIWEYLRGCAQRYAITPHVRFGHDVSGARWSDREQRWEIQTSAGRLTADVLIAGLGALSDPAVPDIPGIDGFDGTIFHSARWRHDHDLRGERIAVIGTGASAIQFVPRIQPDAGELHVFQRTPPWIMPHPDRPITRWERAIYKALPGAQRLMREGIYWARETFVVGFLNERVMRLPERLARLHLRRQVPDPALRAKLTPSYRIGCKRILISNEYLPALAKPNVSLHTGGVKEIRGRTVIAGDGSEREVDTIIFGTGFHVTDMPAAKRIRGRDGLLLDDVWQGSPAAYKGTTIAGFPNLFMLVGPNTGLGHSSMVYMIEAQIAYVMDCLNVMRKRGASTVDVRPESQAAYVTGVHERMRGTVWDSGCKSWYLDAQGRNSTIWPGFTWRFARLTRRFDPDHYRIVAGVPAPAGQTTVPAAATSA